MVDLEKLFKRTQFINSIFLFFNISFIFPKPPYAFLISDLELDEELITRPESGKSRTSYITCKSQLSDGF